MHLKDLTKSESSQSLLWGSDVCDECKLQIVESFMKWEVKSISEEGKILYKGSGAESSFQETRMKPLQLVYSQKVSV